MGTKNGKVTQNIIAYLFIAPAMIFFLLFIIIPAVQSLTYSFTSWNNLNNPKDSALKFFIGLGNYKDLVAGMFSDSHDGQIFRQSLINNIFWILGSVTIPVFLALLVANFMVRGKVKFATGFQLMFFLPEIIALSAGAIAWRWMFSDTTSPVTYVVRNWLHNKDFSFNLLANHNHTWLFAMIALYIVQVWCSYGFLTVIYVSAMRNIDEGIYEAAKIDGCGAVGQFLHITLPSLRATTTSVMLLSIIWSFMLFDIVYLMFIQTHTVPEYARVLSYGVYFEGAMKHNIGYAATYSIVMCALVLIVSNVFEKIRTRGDK